MKWREKQKHKMLAQAPMKRGRGQENRPPPMDAVVERVYKKFRYQYTLLKMIKANWDDFNYGEALDEFVIVLRGIPETRELAQVCTRVLARVLNVVASNFWWVRTLRCCAEHVLVVGHHPRHD